MPFFIASPVTSPVSWCPWFSAAIAKSPQTVSYKVTHCEHARLRKLDTGHREHWPSTLVVSLTQIITQSWQHKSDSFSWNCRNLCSYFLFDPLIVLCSKLVPLGKHNSSGFCANVGRKFVTACGGMKHECDTVRWKAKRRLRPQSDSRINVKCFLLVYIPPKQTFPSLLMRGSCRLWRPWERQMKFITTF